MATKDASGSRLKKGFEGKLGGPIGEFTLRSEGTPACSEACPAGIDVKAYVNLIADRRYEDAVEVIRRNNPFPGVCGRVCTHPCEEDCGRADIDDPVSIRMLKRFASDYARSRKRPSKRAAPPKGAKKVAVVGAGPAGLAAAADLAREGFAVTVFDANQNAGGILSWGIPDFRLPKAIVRAEVREIESLGVEIKLGQKVEKPSELLKKGFSAVILATGCQAPVELGIGNEAIHGMLDCLDFLKDVSSGKCKALPGKAIVIGGGNAALDAARTALRLGAKVTIAYRRTEEEMPADAQEIAEAKEEGIKFQFLALLKRIKAKDGKVSGMEFQKAQLGEPDGSGRRSPVPIEGSYLILDADWIIRAAGSKPEPSSWAGLDLKLTSKGTLLVDEKGRTSAKGIFAAGDVVFGPATIVEAIGAGHIAAGGVMEFLGKKKDKLDDVKEAEMLVLEDAPAKVPRVAIAKAPAASRGSGFAEVEMPWDELSAVAEASRCRRCGPCSDCDLCLAVCQHRQAILAVKGKDDGQWVKVPMAFSKRLAEDPKLRKGWALDSEGKKSQATLEPLQAIVDKALCIACGLCDEACVYRAVRVKFEKGKVPAAVVDNLACRGCGACASVCPTGAVSQGYMDDARLFQLVRDAAKESKGGVAEFSCFWRRPEDALKKSKGKVNVICTRRVSPALVLEALVSGASGVALVGCAEGDCHYLPGHWMGKDVAARLSKALEVVGVDPRRVRYLEADLDGSATSMFAAELKKSKLGAFEDVAGKLPESRSTSSRAIAAMHALMAQPDLAAKAQKKGDYVLAPGCAPVVGAVLDAYGLEGAGPMVESALALMNAKGLKVAAVPGLLGPGVRLKKWGLPKLYKSYADAAIKGIKASGAKTLVTISSEAHEKFKKDWPKDFGKQKFDVVLLPDLLASKMKPSDFEAGEQVTVAIESCCCSASTNKLLSMIPGIKVVEAKSECGEPFWSAADAKSVAQAKAVLAEAESKGADVVVVDEPGCLAHLLAAKAGWSESAVDVTDVYSFILSRTKGVGSDE